MGKIRSKGLALRLIAAMGIALLVAGNFTAVGADAVGTRSAGSPINLFWIAMNRTDNQQTPVLDASAEPNADVLLSFAGNYSAGWENATVEIRAWYDRGQTGNSSEYPAETDRARNSAFRLVYCPANQTAWAMFPGGDLEISMVSASDSVSIANPAYPDQSIHTVELELFLGAQVRNANGGGFQSGDVLFDPDPENAMLDPRSWDLNITVMDKNNPLIADTLYGEFGITSSVSIIMSGNPAVIAEPGDHVKMEVGSNIQLSSNSVYWVNVTTSDLLLGGTGPESIPVTNISVRNTHPMANASNSGISQAPMAFTGENQPLSVWGLGNAYMAPAGNGTFTSGPWMTDFNSENITTLLEWWVSVPRGTPLGTYWATIVVSIDSGIGGAARFTPKQLGMNGGVQVVDLTPPVSEVTKATSQNVSAEAYDDETKVENVTLWYRFSEDNETWGDWTEYGTDVQEPWYWNGVSPDGEGYYEFYTVARDSADNTELAPLTADASFEKDATMPGFEMPIIILALSVAMLVFAVRKRRA